MLGMVGACCFGQFGLRKVLLQGLCLHVCFKVVATTLLAMLVATLNFFSTTSIAMFWLA